MAKTLTFIVLSLRLRRLPSTLRPIYLIRRVAKSFHRARRLSNRDLRLPTRCILRQLGSIIRKRLLDDRQCAPPTRAPFAGAHGGSLLRLGAPARAPPHHLARADAELADQPLRDDPPDPARQQALEHAPHEGAVQPLPRRRPH